MNKTARNFKEGIPIHVFFNPKIQADGNIALARVAQGDQEVQLTRQQMEALVAKFNERLERKP